MLYRYKALTRAGASLSGEMEALDRTTVLQDLHQLGHFPIEVMEIKASASGPNRARSSLFSGLPSSRQITLFTRELGMLIKAGLPLDQALAFLERDAGSKALGRLIGRIGGEISSGKSFCEALELQGGAFPPIYSRMVRVAEASGTLETVLERIATGREKSQKLKSMALSEVLYPCLLIVMAIAAVTIMLTVVVPRFKDMISNAGTKIPDQARFVIGASDWLLANWEYLLAAIAATIIILVLGWSKLRGHVENLLLRLPLIGSILKLNLTVRFCRTLGMLIENGIDLPSAMKLVGDVIGNKSASAALERSYDALRKGRSFLDPLAQSAIFPPVLINMLRVGEETGSLSSSLQHMAEVFEEKLERTVERTFTIFEPVIILLVSGIIAFIIVSILSAVISINDLAI
ncbi:type II secretion system F family protein [Hyphomicrobium sp. DY-1]|uniref:type II secretion system F family protein n=1 Tax=Hyphomicrobium sp. DY-1 TaxID=3075650 RepID=UPI0039C3C569